jgi:nitrogen fixation/metabolism regulation signal transduction histidine kinase
MRRRESRHERQVLLLGLLAPLPAILLALVLLASAELSTGLKVLLGGAALGVWQWGVWALRARVAGALATVSSLLTSLRQGDFSVRGHKSGGSDALGTALAEINGLADTLARQRASALEATALLGKVIAEIDVAVFAFDRSRRLKLVNRAGERLFAGERAVGLGAEAAELGLGELLEGPAPRTVELNLPLGVGQWQLQRSSFRLEGLPHELVVLSDLRRALREEERQAWQRIIRVIGHEINNSLAPIRSIAEGLQDAIRTPSAERPRDFEDDLARGLAVIDRRSAALDRFMTSYARLAKLPPPRLAPVEVGAWLRRVVELEQRLPVRLARGPSLTILGDGDQLDQLLINLVRNGVDAAVETGGTVDVSWRKLGRQVEILVLDEGPGVADTGNLFVPFFTTKPSGSGIGLVLSRQICEAHRGTLTLEPRNDRRGAVARLLLPL